MHQGTHVYEHAYISLLFINTLCDEGFQTSKHVTICMYHEMCKW